MRYKLTNHLIPLKEGEEWGDGALRVELVTKDAFSRCPDSLPHKRVMVHHLDRIQYCKAEMFGGCIVGTFAVPRVKNLPGKKEEFGFYLTKDHLLLVEENGAYVQSVLDRLKGIHFEGKVSMPLFFTVFLDHLIEGYSLFLQEYESRLIVMEEGLTKHIEKNFYETVIQCRKEILHLRSFFTQMENVGDVLRSNMNHMLTDEERDLFAVYSHRAGRLNNHADMLREYLLQIREMYETQLAIAQNHTMNLLAVVTTIFLPLTLIVGWYGMNFNHMPELTWKYGYPVIVIVCIVTVTAEIVYFRKKHIL